MKTKADDTLPLADGVEVYPEPKLTPEDVNRLATIDEERYTEGRQRRPQRINYHD